MARVRSALLTVVYSSSATEGLDSLDLHELLSESRVRNRAASITGMLIEGDGRFLQALEGPDEHVRELMDRIAVDPRHHGVHVLAAEAVDRRRFPDWSMAHHRIGDPEAEPLSAHFDALLEARDELPAPSTRTARLRSWIGGAPR